MQLVISQGITTKVFVKHYVLLTRCRFDDTVSQKVSLKLHVLPVQPLATVGTEIFHHRGLAYLIIVDYTSDCIEVEAK